MSYVRLRSIQSPKSYHSEFLIKKPWAVMLGNLFLIFSYKQNGNKNVIFFLKILKKPFGHWAYHFIFRSLSALELKILP